MEFQEEAVVLSARGHGDTGAIVELLFAAHGRRLAYVAGGSSRRIKPFLQPGAEVMADYRARTSEHLGSVRLEPLSQGPAALFDDRLALAGLNAASAVAQGALPEREPHPGAYFALKALMAALTDNDIWPAVFVRFEAGLLDDLGFGLDLTRCAVSGGADDLIWVSPRTGRAVSRAAGAPYADRLLRLPPFLLGNQGALAQGDVRAGLEMTGHFLEQYIFHPLNRPLPAARTHMIDLLDVTGRL